MKLKPLGRNELDIEDAELRIYLRNGNEFAIEVSPAMLDLLVAGCGIHLKPQSDGGIKFSRLCDKDIAECMLPRVNRVWLDQDE